VVVVVVVRPTTLITQELMALTQRHKEVAETLIHKLTFLVALRAQTLALAAAVGLIIKEITLVDLVDRELLLFATKSEL